MITVFSFKSTGGTIAEAFLTLGKIPFKREEVNYDVEGPQKDKLLKYNPLAQLPTLILPDNKILTETLAVAAYVQSQNPQAGLIPKNFSDEFWRWAVFIVAAIYPTFTYGDFPEKWVADKNAAPSLKESTDRHRCNLWKQVEETASEPYFLGAEFSAIDVYITVMSRWRPRQEWFKKNCPKLFSIATRVEKDPRLAEVWKFNFS